VSASRRRSAAHPSSSSSSHSMRTGSAIGAEGRATS
jgi:hypothetical protein